MSIRLRFTLMYTVILALTLTAFGLMLYTIQAGATLKAQEDILVDVANRIVNGRRLQTFLDNQPRPPFTERDWRDTRDMPDAPFRDQDVVVQVREPGGEIVFQSGTLSQADISLSEEGLAAILRGETWTEISRLEGARLLIHSAPIIWDDQVVEIAQVARSLAERDSALESLGRNLLIGGGVVVLAAFGIGWLLSGLVLQPIKRITRTAGAIGAQRDFSRRVEFAGPHDEVGQLATMFNEMLTELHAAYQQLEQALRLQQRFVADVSHELRTPLTTIRGNIELLRRQPPISAEDQGAAVTDIVDETERLIRLVNDLLLLERTDAGQHLRHQPVRVKQVVEEACHLLKPLDPDRSVRHDNVHDVAVSGDPDAFKQVVLILLDNAFTHTDGEIVIETRVESHEVAVSIRDAGPGIDPLILPHIFERFYRGEHARTKPGTGLGLPIARNLIESQGGALDVESSVEDGSTFTITLPRATMPRPHVV
jgi:two-component system, OmpR family, sensor kinase